MGRSQHESFIGIRVARLPDRRRSHDCDGPLGAFAEAAWNAVAQLRFPRPLDRSSPDGQWTHEGIAKAAPVNGELWMGWFAHYSIGVTFSALLLAVYGSEWARKPTLLPALSIGIITVVAPFFILQPALGAGIASSKTPRPVFNSIKSLATHTVSGLGLYLAALATA